MSTKERILEKALALFADHGYDGIGVDGIAEAVGIKGPSLYRHFKGKEEILNALIDKAESHYDEFFGSTDHIGIIPENKVEFITMTMKRISFTMTDPMIQMIRKLLVQEQFRNERVAQVTSKHQMDGIMGMYEKIIRGMMDKGLVKKDDAGMLAMELAAPAVLMIAKADRQPECREDMLDAIEKHLRHFCDEYMKS